MAVLTPWSARTAGDSMVILASSGLTGPQAGPGMTGTPSWTSSSGIRWASVPWTMTHFSPNSLEIRMAVACRPPGGRECGRAAPLGPRAAGPPACVIVGLVLLLVLRGSFQLLSILQGLGQVFPDDGGGSHTGDRGFMPLVVNAFLDFLPEPASWPPVPGPPWRPPTFRWS